MDSELSFDTLATSVENIHEVTSSRAKNAVNQLLTIRNWAIGCYIVEFEQNGQDRAEYGSHLLSNLADRLQIKGLDNQYVSLEILERIAKELDCDIGDIVEIAKEKKKQ